MQSNEEKVKKILTRSVDHIHPSREVFEKVLRSGKRLRVYCGVDPTGPHLHLGHLTNLLVLRWLQDLGHEIIFLIGDFTGRIGDPTDKMTERRPLEKREVKKNMRTFKDQASRVLSFFSWREPSSWKNPVKVRYNSKWYKKMKLEKFMYDLLAYFSVQNLLDREDFHKRYNEHKSIQLKEFVYPLLQGYDGVRLDVDVEVGGDDQLFNMSVGRALRKAYIDRLEEKKWWKFGIRSRAPDATTQGEKFFVTTRLLVDPNTGKKLMNKSEGGMINLDDTPQELFGKIMAVSDEGMFEIARLCTEMDLERIKKLEKDVVSKILSPKIAKQEIAQEVIKVLYGVKEAYEAQENFEKLFSRGEVPENVDELKIGDREISALDLVVLSGAGKSKSEARRLIEQGGFEIDGIVHKDPLEKSTLRGGEVVRIGKKKFFRIVL